METLMKLISNKANFDRNELYKEAFELKKNFEESGFSKKISEIYKNIGENLYGEYDIKYTKYISLYITLQTVYKNFHWLTHGTAYYADHQLFDRLYDSVTEEIDYLVEKMISLFGRECSNPVVTAEIVANNLKSIIGGFATNCDPDQLVAIALYFEILFLEINNEFYKSMDASGGMSMGLDDLIMANHNTHENNLYLLKSRFNSVSLDSKWDKNEQL